MAEATIQDVAKAAGVSASSVSNYMNGRHDQMRVETRERIRQAIETLGYSPSVVARQLKTGRSPILGLVVPSVALPYHGELAEELNAAAQRHGFKLMLCNAYGDAALQAVLINELKSYGVRGIIVTGEVKDPEAINAHVRSGMAFVMFDERAAEMGMLHVDVVHMDSANATTMAVDHLVAQGHQHIAYATFKLNKSSRIARAQGFREAIARHSLGEPLIAGADFAWTIHKGQEALNEGARSIAAELLQMNPRPTAIVAVNDMLAISIMAALNSMGVKIPQDIAIMGQDDIFFASQTTPALTSLRAPYAELAEAAVDKLINRLANPSQASRVTVLQASLIERASCARPA